MKQTLAAVLLLAAHLPAAEAPTQFTVSPRPSVRIGEWLSLDLRAKIQTDFRGAGDDREIDGGMFDLRRARVGVEGRLFQHFEFEVEAEAVPADHQLRDAFVNYRRFRSFQLQAGKFKIPFGRDQLAGATNLDFIHRSHIGSELAPARDVGFMVHGKLGENGLKYQAGLFRHDGENAEAKDNLPTGSRTLAARMVGRPAEYLPLPAMFRTLEVGAAFTHSEVAEGLNSLRGRTPLGDTFFSRMYVNGSRWRTGLEAAWTVGRLGFAGEYISAREGRAEQGLMGNDLPDLISRGWYASATYTLAKAKSWSKRDADVWSLRSLAPGLQPGVVELAARYEQIRFGSDTAAGLASRNPRAANVLGNSDRAATFGVNWNSNRFTRFQFNLVRETIEDPLRSPVSGGQRLWSLVGRIQFVL